MEIDKSSIKELLLEALQEHHDKADGDHVAHHEWIQERIEAEKDRRRMYRAFTRTFISWGLPIILTGLLAWFQTGHWPKVDL